MCVVAMNCYSFALVGVLRHWKRTSRPPLALLLRQMLGNIARSQKKSTILLNDSIRSVHTLNCLHARNERGGKVGVTNCARRISRLWDSKREKFYTGACLCTSRNSIYL